MRRVSERSRPDEGCPKASVDFERLGVIRNPAERDSGWGWVWGASWSLAGGLGICLRLEGWEELRLDGDCLAKTFGDLLVYCFMDIEGCRTSLKSFSCSAWDCAQVPKMKVLRNVAQEKCKQKTLGNCIEENTLRWISRSCAGAQPAGQRTEIVSEERHAGLPDACQLA